MMDNKENIAVLQFIASQYAAPNFSMERAAMNAAISALKQQGEAVGWKESELQDAWGAVVPLPSPVFKRFLETLQEMYPLTHHPKPVVSDSITRKQLEYALNCMSVDSAMNTPDFELAEKLFEWAMKYDGFIAALAQLSKEPT